MNLGEIEVLKKKSPVSEGKGTQVMEYDESPAPVQSDLSSTPKVAPKPAPKPAPKASVKKASKKIRTDNAMGKSQRRMVRIGLLAVTGIVGLAGGVTMLHRASASVPVYVATKGIPAGAIIKPNDIAVSNVPAPGVQGTLPLSNLLNKVATVAVMPGQIFTTGMTQASALPNAEAIIGLNLGSGHLPTTGIQVGTRMEMVYTNMSPLVLGNTTNNAQATPSATPGEALGVAVVTAVQPTGSGSALIDLLIPSDKVSLIATAAANGDITLARRS